MRDVMEAVEGWVTGGDRVALATVVDTKKSAPQPSGTKMAVNDGGKMIGAVSGGCVEGQVVQVAEGILAGDDPQLLHYGIADEDRLGRRVAVRRRDLDLGGDLRGRRACRDASPSSPAGVAAGRWSRCSRARKTWARSCW